MAYSLEHLVRLSRLALQLVLLSLISFTGSAQDVTAKPNPDITLSKSETGNWTLKYALSTPAHKLVFVRNPDMSRAERWTPEDDDFMVSVDENGEFIARIDGQAFSDVSIKLTPTYRSLPKDYAPFSPFSDGGSLTYSGRYFACAETCDSAENSWNITAVPPAGEHVIVNGSIFKRQTAWQDSDSGRNFYIGKQTPAEGSSFVAVIDNI